MFVIKRTDQGGGYVAANSGTTGQTYTHDLSKAETFATEALANQNRCPGNEIVLPVNGILQQPRRN